MSVRAVARFLCTALLLAHFPGSAWAAKREAPAREEKGDASAREAEADDATARARARDEWYNEGYGRPRAGTRSSGPWSPAFRRFMLEAAARERRRWGSLIPGAEGEPAEDALGGGPTWSNIGPTRADFIFNGVTLNVSDSGRIRSIVPHPSDANTLYVAVSGGGVWRTTNGGASWTPLTEALGTLSIGSLEMDPSNPSVLYLGLGDPFDGTGIGLVKSTDGGANWSAPVFLGSSLTTAQVMVSPTDPTIVLATTNTGLFRSTDSGANFSNVPLATGGSATVGWSLAWAGGTNFVVTVEGTGATTVGQIWYSSNSGATWTRATGVTSAGGLNRITVASAPSLRSTLYALAANPGGQLADIFRSTDAGQTWKSLQTTHPSVVYQNPVSGATTPSALFNTQGWYDQMLIVSPTDPNVAFYGGALHAGKLTFNGGPPNAARWGQTTYRVVSEWLGRFGLPYVHADFHAAAFDAAGNLYFGSDGGIFKSTNGGTTFTDTLNVGLVTHLIYNVGSSLDTPSAVIGGFQDNGTRVRSGVTSTFNQTIGGDGFGCNIKSSNGQEVLGSLYYARIQKSVNAGASFSSACSGIVECNNSATAPFLTKIVPWEGSPTGDVLYTSSNTVVYRTTDYAGSWSPLPASLPGGGNIRHLGAARSNPAVVGIVANGGRAFLSNDSGASWITPAALPNNGLSLSYIWFDTTNPDIVYVASVAPDFTRTHLWKSVNFGASWTAIDGGGFPAGVPVDVVRNDPNNPAVLYAGTHLGVYRSADGGATWVRYGAGMPLVEVTDLYISPDGSLTRVSTFGRGFWQLVP
jgi:hypothetical protein